MNISTELTNMCMIRNGSKVLVQNRLDPLWSGITFPGGHIEPNESFADAVIREVWEETGLTIAAPKLCGVKQWLNSDCSRTISFLYETDQFTGELISSEEGEVFWTEMKDLPAMGLASGMAETLNVFFNPQISELVYTRKDKIHSDSEWHYEDWTFQLK